jgi:uncharacterized protein (DUF58 family)
VKATEFVYRLPGRAPGTRPGAHGSRRSGEGHAFRHLAPLTSYPDPRRLDLRASLTDPFENWHVRLYEQRSAINVFALIDVSRSMSYRGRQGRGEVLADFLAALAASVYRHGDRLGIVAASDRVHGDLTLPLTRQPGPAYRLCRRLREMRSHGTGCRGLIDAARLLPGHRSLVFLVSDFHFPLALLRDLLSALVQHAIVPLVLWDEGEGLPNASGLAQLADLETGNQRLLVLRPALRDRLADNLRQRRERLTALFRQSGREPLYLLDGFDADRLTRYFLRVA